MGNEPRKSGEKLQDGTELTVTQGSDPLLIDEFDIIELEDRLELADRCNINCAPK